ncbi:MAG: hypothetical protein JWO22_1907 [Frankiales bacterium]|nr:hypothetical protein [Frankiales bacterium]
MTAKKPSLQADLQADVLADLAGPAEEVTAPPVVEPTPAPPELTEATPALSLKLTPLKWSRPKVTTVRGGLGKSVAVGPWRVELSVKE